MAEVFEAVAEGDDGFSRRVALKRILPGDGDADAADDREDARGEKRETKSSSTVIVLARDFDDALAELSPSLTDADVAHYARMRENFEGSRGGGRR